MKKFLLITLMSATVSAALFSCNNGDYTAAPDGGGGTNNGSCVCKDPMSARIGGTEWVAATATSQTQSTPLGNSLIISGTSGSYLVVLTVSNYTGTKDYTMGGIDASCSVSDVANANKMYASTSGTIKFTDDATNYVGTFSTNVKAQDGATLNVSGGYFNVAK